MTVSLSFLVKLSSFTSSSEDREYKYFILGGSGGSGHIRSTSFCGVAQPANKAMAEAATNKIPLIPPFQKGGIKSFSLNICCTLHLPFTASLTSGDTLDIVHYTYSKSLKTGPSHHYSFHPGRADCDRMRTVPYPRKRS